MVRSQEYGLNQPPPAWHVAGWFNANNDVSLEKLRGRVIALHTFQMLCPGCVAHGTPTLILIDRFGIVCYHVFGRPDDMSVGTQMAMLLSERVATSISKNLEDVKQETRAGYDDTRCSLDR